MFFAVITLFPEMFEAITAYGISGRAAKSDLVQVTCINPRDYAEGNYKRVDERPFGGGPGMVMMAEPLAKAIQHAKELAMQAGAVLHPIKRNPLWTIPDQHIFGSNVHRPLHNDHTAQSIHHSRQIVVLQAHLRFFLAVTYTPQEHELHLQYNNLSTMMD